MFGGKGIEKEITRECLRSFSRVTFDRYVLIVGDPIFLAEGIMPCFVVISLVNYYGCTSTR